MTLGWESVDDAILAVVSAWNVFGLPALLMVVAAWSWRSNLVHGGRGATVRRLGLVHYGLALWTAAWLAGELRSYAGQGGFPANPWVTALPWVSFGAACDLAVGFGLRGLRRGARPAAVALALWRTALDILVTAVAMQHGATIDWTEWPRLAVSYVLAPFLLVVLLLPRTARAFRERDIPTDPPPTPDTALGLVARLMAVVVGSVALTDALDTALRFLADRWGAG